MFFGQLLMPVFPGQMRYVRKNLYHAVYVIDPASPKGLLASLFFVATVHPIVFVLYAM